MNAMVTVFTMLWLLMISGYKQMYHLYHIDREVEIAESDYTSLENILKLEAGYEAYMEYLKTELSAENLFFWQVCVCVLALGCAMCVKTYVVAKTQRREWCF